MLLFLKGPHGFPILSYYMYNVRLYIYVYMYMHTPMHAQVYIRRYTHVTL